MAVSPYMGEYNDIMILFFAHHHRQTSENDTWSRNDDNLVWNKTEKLLADAEGHVLEIFDW